MAAPKKRRIKLVLIIVLSRVIADLENDVTSGLNFNMESSVKQAEAMADTESDEQQWTRQKEDVYEATDSLGTLLEGGAGSGQLILALGALDDALSAL